MAKGWEGITSDGETTQITNLKKLNGNGYAASMNIEKNCTINFSNTPQSPMGGKDFISMETPFPVSCAPIVPAKVPTQVPLQEYLLFLPTAKKALTVALVSTGINATTSAINKKVT